MSLEHDDTARTAEPAVAGQSRVPDTTAGVEVRAADGLRRRPERRLSPGDAATLQRAVGNRAFARLMRGQAQQSLQREGVIEVEVLTQHDSYTDRSGYMTRVGDAHGPNILMNIVDVPGGDVRFHWFNFRTGFAQTGRPADWEYLAVIDIAVPGHDREDGPRAPGGEREDHR